MDHPGERTIATVSASGTVEIPEVRRRIAGLEDGGPVVVRVEDGEIRLRSVQAMVKALQDEARVIFAGSGESVERFLADRRTEAAADE